VSITTADGGFGRDGVCRVLRGVSMRLVLFVGIRMLVKEA
jgi:hypothetical protein